MKNKIFFYSFPFLFIMCSHPSDKSASGDKSFKNLNKVGEVQFDLGFARTTTDNFEYKGKDYIAFADFRTYKKIELSDVEENKVYSLSIKKLMEKEGEQFIAMSFSSPDTIALLTQYTNKVYVINKDGEILDQKDYSLLLLKGVELSPPLYFKNNQLRVGVQYNDNTLPENPKLEDFKDSDLRANSFYRLMWDSLISKTTTSTLQLDSIYTRFVTRDQMAVEANHILFKDSINIFYSSYNDSLYLFDLMGKFKKGIGIKSKNVKTKVTPVTWEEYREDAQSLSRNWWEGSFITNLYWDKYRELYYCFVRDKMIGKKLPFFVFIYDKNFNKLEELEMDYNKYSPNAFVGKEGLYIHHVGEDFKIPKYSIFRYVN